MKNLIPVTAFLLLTTYQQPAHAQDLITVLNFQGDSGYQHASKDEALEMVELLGKKNGWKVVSSADPATLESEKLARFDVIVFNNNCGTSDRIFSDDQQQALQSYVRGGGGFVGIHCAGAIWKEGGEFQTWYEKLIGTRLVAHPHVQTAKLIVEHQCHHCTAHLPKEWIVKDEWHKFSYNPREHVNVLISLDETSYEGDANLKMGGDHPFTWYQYYDGGRSFFTSLGHTEEVYKNADYQRLVEGGIEWAAGKSGDQALMVKDGLVIDLNADHDVVADQDNRVTRWTNQVRNFPAQDFVINDYGVRLRQPGSGSPLLKTKASQANGHNTIVFREDELVNMQEDALDHLLTGSGYTWFAVINPYLTPSSDEKTPFGLDRLQDVNSFLGNLKNSEHYEGIWGCFNDDLTVWCGSRNGITFGRFDENNPKVSGPKLEANQYYIVAARMGKGTQTVPVEIFVNDAVPSSSVPYFVNTESNPSKLAIGTERDATNHPGSESFDGEIARILIYEKPLSKSEMRDVMSHLQKEYGVKDQQ